MPADTQTIQRFTRQDSIWVSRVIIVVVLGSALGSYFWTPVGPLEWTVDLLVRTYLHFVAGALAHEGTHGHLGNSRAANDWWGRLAVTTALVPWITFKKTHLSHHAHTNVPGKDPDAFLNSASAWQVPLRILAMPHQWFFWLRRQGKVNREVLVELAITYVAYFALYGTLAVLVGPGRLLAGAFGAAFLHSFLLWMPFAMKTHEGYSTGAPEGRSHNYFGHLPFFFSFGLSLHRVHHLKPKLSWLEMLPHVERGTLWQSLTFRRDAGRHECGPV